MKNLLCLLILTACILPIPASALSTYPPDADWTFTLNQSEDAPYGFHRSKLGIVICDSIPYLAIGTREIAIPPFVIGLGTLMLLLAISVLGFHAWRSVRARTT